MARQNEEKRAELDQKISILQEMIRIIEEKNNVEPNPDEKLIRINQLIIDDYKNKLSLLVKERENNDWETINLEDIDKPSTSQNKWNLSKI
ncbi:MULTISPECIES: hypothetical protein [unclassified Spiroplasma]|uniref:hypothetical protein n=1 Tax=unclassified Spiroplasma TaxID=2637901 RepID=UPI0020799779|nr:hypothetical protein [Spiroplasma endosymbiont of Lariophagus distinguendus]